jgi:hypothetical protein
LKPKIYRSNNHSNNESQELSIEDLMIKIKNTNIPTVKPIMDSRTFNKDITETSVGKDVRRLDELKKVNNEIQTDFYNNLAEFIKSIGYTSKFYKIEERTMVFHEQTKSYYQLKNNKWELMKHLLDLKKKENTYSLNKTYNIDWKDLFSPSDSGQLSNKADSIDIEDIEIN